MATVKCEWWFSLVIATCLPFVVVYSLSHGQIFATAWTAACQGSLSFPISWNLLRFMSAESVMLSNHLIFCCPLPCCLQSFPASGSFPVSWLFASGDQSFGASASVLPINIQGWFPLGLTSLISLQSKGLLWSYLLSVEISFVQIYTNFPEFRRSRWWHPALVLLPGKIPWMEEPGRL